jgi:hypothetical protein
MLAAGLPGFDSILGEGGTATFFRGGAWPEPGQIQAIELALGWPYGTVESIVNRPPYSSLSGTEHALVGLIHDMPEPDRRALIELLKVTKAHSEATARKLQEQAGEIDSHLRTIQGRAV